MRWLAIICLVPTLAWAHGDAQWIMDDPKTSYCCGVIDCWKEPEGAVMPAKGGYRITDTGQFFPFGHPDVHPSKDGDYWTCRPPHMGGAVKCLFVPLSS